MKLVMCILGSIWGISYLIFIFYLYCVNKKPHHSSFLEEQYNQVPSPLTPNELSILLYKKIVPSTFTANILLLIQGGIITVEKMENDYLFLRHDYKTMSDSQKELIILLFEEMGSGDSVYLTQIDRYCNTHSGCSNFLAGYQIWKRETYRESRYNFYEEKRGYMGVKLFKNIALLLMLLNYIMKTHLIFIYLIFIPTYCLHIYFYKIYKRTKEANTEYYKWLGYKHYLMEKDEISEAEEANASIYGTVLGCASTVEAKLPKHDFFIIRVESVITRCIRKSILKGDRSIKIKWNSK